MKSASIYKKKISTFEHLYVIGIVLLCIVTTSSTIGLLYNTTLLEYLICFLLLFASSKVKVNYEGYTWMAILFLLLTLIQLIIYPQKILYWGRYILLFILFSRFAFFLISREYPILQVFYRIFFILTVLSLGEYVAVEFLNIGLPSVSVTTEWTQPFTLYYWFYSPPAEFSEFGMESLFGIRFKRNDGIFIEPGLFAVFLCFMLFIHLFTRNKKSYVEQAVILLTLLTTYSTTGLMVAAVLYGYYFYTKSSRKLGGNIVMGLFILLAIFFFIDGLLIQKSENHVNSYGSRMFDLWGGLQLFIQSPIWGWGYQNIDVYNAYSSSLFGLRTNSNGFIIILYQLGLMGLSLYIIPFKRFYSRLKMKFDKRLFLLFVVVWIMLIMGEPIQYTTTGLVILAYLCAKTSINVPNKMRTA